MRDSPGRSLNDFRYDDWLRGPWHSPKKVGLGIPQRRSTIGVPSMWGSVLSGVPDLPDHVLGHMISVPEGLLITAHCSVCGGHAETLLDGRAMQREVDRARAEGVEPESAWDAAGERGGRELAMREAFDRIRTQWGSLHAACPESPREHEVSAELEALTRDGLRVARKTAAEGTPLSPGLLLQLSDGRAVGVSLANLPDRPRLLALELASRKYGVREFLRDSGLSLAGAVLIARGSVLTPEQWTEVERKKYASPENHPGRREVLMSYTATPEFVRETHVPLLRSGRSISFGAPEVRPAPEPLVHLEGLLTASSIPELEGDRHDEPVSNP